MKALELMTALIPELEKQRTELAQLTIREEQIKARVGQKRSRTAAARSGRR